MGISEKILTQIKTNDPALTELHLSSQYPPLTHEDMREFVDAMKEGKNTHLKRVLFYDNEIGDDGATILAEPAGLDSVETLMLSGNNLTDKGATAVARMNLTTLSVDGNSIRNAGFKKLLEMSALKSLHAHYNEINEKVIPAIYKNPLLTELTLEENKFTDKQLAEIQQHIEKNTP